MLTIGEAKKKWFKLGIVAAALILTAATGARADWSFAVLCDSRSGYSTDPVNYQSPDGISPYFKNIALALSREGSAIDFVLSPGDLTRGKKPYNMAAQLTANLAQWNTFMQPVYNAGIPVYNVRGNHDAYGVNPDVNGNPTTDSTSIWKSGTTISTVNPLAMDTGAQDGLSYSFTHKGSLFLGIDEYVGSGLKVTSTSYDKTFVQSQLATPGVAHKFVFAHQPLWNYKYDELGPAGLADDLQAGHADLYFSGHVHSYQRIKEAGYRFQEMIIGSAGAPESDPTLQPGDPSYLYDPNLTVLSYDGGTSPKFGYAVVTVHDNGTITSVMKFFVDPTDPNSAVYTFDAADVTPSFTDVSSKGSVASTGFVYSRATQKYTGNLTITNTGGVDIVGKVDVALNSLTSGVTLTNATGQYINVPYITVATNGLAAGGSTTVSLQFTDPSNARISFTPVTYLE